MRHFFNKTQLLGLQRHSECYRLRLADLAQELRHLGVQNADSRERSAQTYLTMKKTLFTLSSLFALAGAASAGYVWNGGNGAVALEQWTTQSNWTLTDGSEWGSNGPNLTAGKYAIPITIANSITFADNLSLNGFNLHLSIQGESAVSANFVKFQNVTLTVDKGSSLTAMVRNQMENLNLRIDGTLVVNAGNNKDWNGSITLGNESRFTIRGAQQNAKAFTINATLFDAIAEGTGAITTRTLVNYDNASLSNVSYNFGDGVITGAKQYKITNDSNGISVSYMTDSVPEPATATLSLLALAAHRRRKQ